MSQAVGASPVRNGKKGVNGKTSMIQGSSCIEKTAVSVVTYQDMLAKTEGPQMRVSVIKISRRINDDTAEFLQPTVSLEAA